MHGRHTVWGGRAELRAVLYMAVMVVLLRLNSYLPSFKEGKHSGQALCYSVFKGLNNMFSASLFNI